MKEQINKLISEYPKHYSMMIRKNKLMLDWIDSNTLTTSTHLVTRIYSALNQSPSICKNNNERAVSRMANGYIFCGAGATCDCLKAKLSSDVSDAKLAYSKEKKESIQTTRCATMLDKFGVENSFQRHEVKAKLSSPKVSPVVYQQLTDYQYLYSEYITKERSLVDIADELGIYYGTVRDYLVKFNFEIRQQSNYSVVERAIGDYVSSLGVNIIRNDRTILGSNLELDIFVPDFKLAIEMNGLYYHSFGTTIQESTVEIKVENKLRHLNKTELARANSVELVHITDYDWYNNQPKIENLIRSKLNLNMLRLQARKLQIKIVPKDDEKKFLNDYHIQGYVGSKICYGLYQDSELIMLTSFGKPRFAQKKYDWELLRLCSKFDTSVAGGMSKLITHFRRSESGTLISYCNYDKSTGKSYLAAGFSFSHKTAPGYFWNDGSNRIINRMKTTHSEMAKWLPTYEAELSQTDNMFKAKFRRYWDCGQLVFVMN